MGPSTGQPVLSLPRHVVLSVTRNHADEPARGAEEPEVPAGDDPTPGVPERQPPAHAGLHPGIGTTQVEQAAAPEGAVVEPLAEDHRLAHRRSSPICARAKATSGPGTRL